MLPRERVLAALAHQTPDRTPTDFWAVEEIWCRLKQLFQTESKDDVLDRLGIDIRRVRPDYVGPPIQFLNDGSYLLPDGTHRKKVTNRFGAHEEYAGFPLNACETVQEILEWDRWPKAEQYDWEGFSRKIGDKHEHYFIKLDLGGPFERAWSLRGYEQYLMDMATEPEIPHAIMERLTEYYVDFVTRAMEAAGDKIDMVYTWDDIASQNSLLISPQMWEEFVKPYHVYIDRVIHGYGKRVMYHSCGAVRPMIHRLMELPIDVLNPLQPLAAGMSDLCSIKKEYGDQLTFHGAIDIQQLLPHGNPDEVYREAHRVSTILGDGGGYILCSAHFIQADTPLENILALYQAAGDTGISG